MLARRKEEGDFYVEQTAPDVSVKARETHPVRHLRTRFFGFILFLAAMAMILTLQNSFIVKNGYDVVQVKSDIFKMEKENERLQLDIAKMKSPQRIQAIAAKDLGMISPQSTYHASAGSQKASYVTIAQQQQSKENRGAGIVAFNKTETKNGL